MARRRTSLYRPRTSASDDDVKRKTTANNGNVPTYVRPRGSVNLTKSELQELLRAAVENTRAMERTT